MAIDLNSLVPDMVDLGFDLADQIVVSATYTHTTSGGYDPATGGLTPVVQEPTVNVLEAVYKANEIDGDVVKIGDKKMIVRASELSTVTSVRLDDRITISGVIWQIVNFKFDPTETVYIFQVRRVM